MAESLVVIKQPTSYSPTQQVGYFRFTKRTMDNLIFYDLYLSKHCCLFFKKKIMLSVRIKWMVVGSFLHRLI